MKISKAPCIASHSACRIFSPTMKRDMTDDMIKKLGENDGVVQINYYNFFVDSAVVNQDLADRKKLEALLEEKGLTPENTAASAMIDQFKKDHPPLRSTIEMVANHIDHVVKLAGIDHVAFGSDYDGVEGQLPTGLEDVSTYPNLIYTLLKRGYSEEDIEKICYKNVWRVWNKVEQVAKGS
jgi:membrane dipeptidase